MRIFIKLLNVSKRGTIPPFAVAGVKYAFEWNDTAGAYLWSTPDQNEANKLLLASHTTFRQYPMGIWIPNRDQAETIVDQQKAEITREAMLREHRAKVEAERIKRLEAEKARAKLEAEERAKAKAKLDAAAAAKAVREIEEARERQKAIQEAINKGLPIPGRVAPQPVPGPGVQKTIEAAAAAKIPPKTVQSTAKAEAAEKERQRQEQAARADRAAIEKAKARIAQETGVQQPAPVSPTPPKPAPPATPPHKAHTHKKG